MGRVVICETAEQASPRLEVLGPSSLSGTRGKPPTKAANQCIEFCAWIFRNPGSTAAEMANALSVAESTRRSNLWRLRQWLGTTDDGDEYLPMAYSGRIFLHPDVFCDWEDFIMAMTVGFASKNLADLERALLLVRGVPLADSRGPWPWASQWRDEIAATVRNLALEITDLALLQRNIEAARWSISTAQNAVPGDHELNVARIRVEHFAGDIVAARRLARAELVRIHTIPNKEVSCEFGRLLAALA